jgi:hypothetical protein
MKKQRVPAIVKHNREVALKNLARNKKIFALAVSGMSDAKIADKMTKAGFPISDTQVHRIVTAALDHELELDKNQFRKMDLKRCTEILEALYPQKRNPEAAHALMRVIERRAKYAGVDAPIETKTDNTNTQVGPIVTIQRDLSKLTDEELATLEKIVRKLDGSS